MNNTHQYRLLASLVTSAHLSVQLAHVARYVKSKHPETFAMLESSQQIHSSEVHMWQAHQDLALAMNLLSQEQKELDHE